MKTKIYSCLNRFFISSSAQRRPWLVWHLRDVRLCFMQAPRFCCWASPSALLKMLSINKELQYFLNQLGDQINSLQRDSMIESPCRCLVSSPEGDPLVQRPLPGDVGRSRHGFQQDVSQVVGKSITTLPARKGFNIRYRDRMYSGLHLRRRGKAGRYGSPFILWTTTT